MLKKLNFVIAIILALLSQRFAAADNGYAHQQEQIRPIRLGTSGGNINDSSTNFCCGGTLGALVQNSNGQYILSNNHVLAGVNIALPGEEIIQPGLIDQFSVCLPDTNDVVAHLASFVAIKFKNGKIVPLNDVDAAIAQVITGAVEPNGAILDIGLVNSVTAEAVIGQSVKKSGRTTGLTVGTITAVDATIDVSYSQECGGGGNNVARFKNQILIEASAFCAAGDSGSLIVENTATNPRAVGLLFAGNSNGSVTIANPINAVLNSLGVAMAGGTVSPKPTGVIKGTVTNNTNRNPLAGATVKIDTGETATTNTDGAYAINNITVGSHTVEVSAAGFNPQVKTASVYENTETVVNFALKPRKGHPKHSLHNAIKHAADIKNRYEQNIFQLDGVVGTGVSLSETDEPVIEIYLDKDLASTRTKIPKTFEDVPVRVAVTGQFKAI